MKNLGYVGAAAIASALCFAATPARAGIVTDASLDLVDAATNTGNGGSFVTKAVKDAFDLTSTEFKYLWTVSTLGASGWYTAITTNDYFTPVTNISQIGPDQIFAINAVTSPAYVGHAVVIIGSPIEITEGQSSYLYEPFLFDTDASDGLTGWRQFAIPIADSTGSPHGTEYDFPDSRRDPATNIFTGSIPGTAYMRLYTNQTTGAIEAYSWSVESSDVYDQSERPFAIGTITPASPYCTPLCTP